MATKVQRIMTQPINPIFRFLQSKAIIQIWLFEQNDLRFEGRIIGFDEYMNLVLDDAEEYSAKKKTRKALACETFEIYFVAKPNVDAANAYFTIRSMRPIWHRADEPTCE
ncbi:hypothetical protein CYMTET_4317 [Cymbomonas tetramitiformis]|uniref:Small nuclear ribonucleoprotein E n=1 Tax=Cymbomonas tetramitiformis TaxID=36881 RepID=A0AAE0LK73_9CHLO|nr:hypothetical protein CYMTET_4317 [Cymbomonas tetramitiformis]